jgi:hypothetical protein
MAPMAKMIYLKSVLAGLGAVAISVFLLPIGFLIYGVFFFRPPPGREGGGEVSWDLRSLFASSLIPWIILLAIFVLGFYWKFRRASR